MEVSSEERKPIEKFTVNGDKVKGIDGIKLDEEVELTMRGKVLRVGRSVWDEKDKDKPMEAEFELISGKVKSIKSAIDGAKSMSDLESAVSSLKDGE